MEGKTKRLELEIEETKKAPRKLKAGKPADFYPLDAAVKWGRELLFEMNERLGALAREDEKKNKMDLGWH